LDIALNAAHHRYRLRASSLSSVIHCCVNGASDEVVLNTSVNEMEVFTAVTRQIGDLSDVTLCRMVGDGASGFSETSVHIHLTVLTFMLVNKGKGKGFPLQALGDPEG
jgi:hypothetical protein